MKTLITGAAGFLGRHFALRYAERGHAVHGLDDMSSPYAKWPEHENINNVQGDAGRFFASWNPGIVMDYDLVLHFAAPVGGREKIEGDPLFNADSLRLDAALFRWASTYGKSAQLVYPSSSAVYPAWMQNSDTETPLREDDFNAGDTQWGAPDEMYGFTKMAGEVLAHKAAKYGVDTLCIRPFSGYGEDQSLEYPVPSIAQRIAKGQNPIIVWGSGQQARDFIHVDDVVGATMARIEYGVEGYQPMNIGTGVPMTFNRLARQAALFGSYDTQPEVENLEDKPQGVSKRFCDPLEMLKYYTPKVSLSTGMKRMVEAYK
jgi:UDP-glucose 4-epimerase